MGNVHMGKQNWGRILPPSHWSRGTAWHSTKITERHDQNAVDTLNGHSSSIKVV